MAQDKDDASARKAIRDDFKSVVNMTPAAIEKWLATDDSKRVGWKGEDGKGSGESVGHASGRHIIAIKRKRQADLDTADYDHMRKVISYVRRHLAQGPANDVATSNWRYSLMNWGHDPCK